MRMSGNYTGIVFFLFLLLDLYKIIILKEKINNGMNPLYLYSFFSFPYSIVHQHQWKNGHYFQMKI